MEEKKIGALGNSYVTNKKFHIATREKIRKPGVQWRGLFRTPCAAAGCSGQEGEKKESVGEEEGVAGKQDR